LPGVVIKGDISTEIKLFIPVGIIYHNSKKISGKRGGDV
jgi:hypothetical protein